MLDLMNRRTAKPFDDIETRAQQPTQSRIGQGQSGPFKTGHDTKGPFYYRASRAGPVIKWGGPVGSGPKTGQTRVCLVLPASTTDRAAIGSG